MFYGPDEYYKYDDRWESEQTSPLVLYCTKCGEMTQNLVSECCNVETVEDEPECCLCGDNANVYFDMDGLRWFCGGDCEE